MRCEQFLLQIVDFCQVFHFQLFLELFHVSLASPFLVILHGNELILVLALKIFFNAPEFLNKAKIGLELCRISSHYIGGFSRLV